MKKIHFFKANSRLGMINIPHKGTQLNLGVETGPDNILTAEFLNKFEDAKVDSFEFSKPESIKKENYYKVLASESKTFAELIKNNLKNDEIQVVIGGDHSVSFGSTLNILHKYKFAKVGILQIDSHADLHLSSTSPSGNFHGMYLRPFFSKFDNDDISNVVQTEYYSVSPNNLMYIGDLELEEEEQRFIDEKNIVALDSDLFESNTIAAIMLLKSFVKSFDHIHISFDIDVFRSDVVNATGTPSSKGFDSALIFDILNIIKKEVSSFSLDLVEVNPARGNSKETIELAQEILTLMTNSYLPLSGEPSTSPLYKGGKGGFLDYSGKLKPYARANRKKPTNAERIFWYEVIRNEKLGYKFLRQKPIDKYILDFYCSKLLLAIELDGDSHNGKESYDLERTKVLESLGIKVIRYDNNRVLTDLETLKNDLLEEISSRKKEMP